MKRRMATLAVVNVGASAVAFLSGAPAHSLDVCVGVGTAALTVPFVYPVIGQKDGDTAPPFQLTMLARTAAFSGTLNGACTRRSGTLHAVGHVTGWCGFSVGRGTVVGSGERFVWIGSGGLLVLTGGLNGVLYATPDIGNGQNCLTGANVFTIAGGGVLTDCTLSKNKSSITTVSLPATLTTVLPGVLSIHTGGDMDLESKVCVGT